jgi:hypothetical protein
MSTKVSGVGTVPGWLGFGWIGISVDMMVGSPRYLIRPLQSNGMRTRREVGAVRGQSKGIRREKMAGCTEMACQSVCGGLKREYFLVYVEPRIRTFYK